MCTYKYTIYSTNEQKNPSINPSITVCLIDDYINLSKLASLRYKYYAIDIIVYIYIYY